MRLVTDIAVEQAGGSTYRVTVTDGGSTTTHEVTVGPAEVEALGGATPESLINASFRFLLDREPKESILSQFELSAIARYFSDYPEKIVDYL